MSADSGGDDVTTPNNMAEGYPRQEPSTKTPEKSTAEPTQLDKSSGEMPETAQEPDAQSNQMESESPSSLSQQPETTTSPPTTMATTPPPNHEETKAAASSNVGPVDSPRGYTTHQPNVDKDSMQGDQPADAPKSTEMPKVGRRTWFLVSLRT